MADLLAQGSTFLANALHRSASSPVVYSDGTNTAEIDAVRGKTEYEQDDGEGGVVLFSERDFLFRRQDLVLDNRYFLPDEGHTITQTVHGAERVWAVKPSSDGRACFEYLDGYETMLRVHCKLISDQTPSPLVPVTDPGEEA